MNDCYRFDDWSNSMHYARCSEKTLHKYCALKLVEYTRVESRINLNSYTIASVPFRHNL